MAGKGAHWRSGEVLAFTEREGPGRPPAGSPAWLTGALSGVLGVTFLGLMASDTLCEEHRVWVVALAGFAIFGVAAASVALWRGRAGAPLMTMLASLAGVAIGLLDAVHSPTRGRLVGLGFALSALLAASMVWRAHRLARWARSVTLTSSDGEYSPDSVAVRPSDAGPAPRTEREAPTPR